ncbi:MAG: DUF433 domain-containing protein [Abitibacteriaceae bacterium]|nr:DUF433 domain-containing protein [Abditibacteriaceae bacterium]MBV9864041.1 DUF433 domain-containing protein [Abditibacteriaceae bacterium]
MNSEPGQSSIITASPDVMSGTPVFAGTRVPLQTLIDYLEAGESIEDFLAGFPTVRREQVIAFLEAAKAHMLATAA